MKIILLTANGAEPCTVGDTTVYRGEFTPQLRNTVPQRGDRIVYEEVCYLVEGITYWYDRDEILIDVIKSA